MREIVGVGFEIPSKEDDFIDFYSKGSLSDADLVVISSDSLSISGYDTYKAQPTYQGKTLYNNDSSFQIREQMNHWKREVDIFLKAGKTVFIILCDKDEFFLQTDQQESIGAGNTKKINISVELFSNYKFIPYSNEIHSINGSRIYSSSPLIKSLNDICSEHFDVEAYIDIKGEHETLFITKNRDKILGAKISVHTGNILFIPCIKFPSSYNTPKTRDWSKEALDWGKRFKECLASIDKALRTNINKTPLPDWANKSVFSLSNSEKIKELIEENLSKIKIIEDNVESLKNELEQQECIKDLLYETGKSLEHAVSNALRLLGYKAENFTDGNLELDQIIISPEGDRFIGECEGKDSKDIDISKFRQLLDSLNEDLSREEVEDKAFGILFGNPQRLIDPVERVLDFTEKCKRAANREKIALIKTTDLFKVVKCLMDNNTSDLAFQFRKNIKDQLGGVVNFSFPDSSPKGFN